MRNNILFTVIWLAIIISCNEKQNNEYIVYSTNKNLSDEEYHVLINKGTEIPFTGDLLHLKEDGIYICRICETPLFSSEAKFDSGTGWPSFDDAIKENVKLIPEDNKIETVCANCGGHLGHVFYGENFTKKDIRYFINSVSLDFISKFTNKNSEK